MAQPEPKPEEKPEEKPDKKADDEPGEQPSLSTVRCPVDGHEGEGCRGLCIPLEGIGLCGREASHGKKKRER